MSSLRKLYDVIIVGAGPAGSICAYELSKKNIQVLLLEREKLPRYKVCAGGLTKKAVDILPEDVKDILEDQTHTVHLSLNHKFTFSKTTSFPLVSMVMRDKFDHFLVKKAIESGAHLKDETRVFSLTEHPDLVTVETSRGTFVSKLLVGADGVTSKVAHLLGIRRKLDFGIALEAELFPKHPDLISNYHGSLHLDFNVIPRGYGWIFPKRKQLSVGVFTTLPSIRNIKSYFYAYVRNKHLRNLTCKSLIGHQIPIGGRTNKLNTERVLLVGDASGLADPITGEGIYFALRSGQIAAETISKKLLKEPSLSLDEYSLKINEEMTENFKYARFLASFLYNISYVSYNIARKAESVNDTFIEVVSGNCSYKEAPLKILKKTLGLDS
ncbi:Menaquinone reductase [bacterium HR37]|nr:Menaquinone reductase [bacterium HR37]